MGQTLDMDSDTAVLAVRVQDALVAELEYQTLGRYELAYFDALLHTDDADENKVGRDTMHTHTRARRTHATNYAPLGLHAGVGESAGADRHAPAEKASTAAGSRGEAAEVS